MQKTARCINDVDLTSGLTFVDGRCLNGMRRVCDRRHYEFPRRPAIG